MQLGHTKPFELVLVNVRSRFNVGAMFRTADAVGITKIHLCGYTPAPPHPKIDKVSLGSEKTVAFETHRLTVPQLKKLKKLGYAIAAVEQSKSSVEYFRYKRPKNKPLVLIMGNEVTGLPASVLRLADVKLEIPMRGQKESLNVGIAFGIVAYRLTYPTSAGAPNRAEFRNERALLGKGARFPSGSEKARRLSRQRRKR